MGRHTPVVFLIALCLAPGAASAQVMGAARAPGFTYHPPPPKPEAPARPDPRPDPRGDHRPTAGEDLFRAGPDTYRPRPGTSPFVFNGGFYPVYATYPSYPTPEVVVQPVIVERTTVVVVEVPQARQEPEAKTEPAPAPPVLVAMPKTIYVIPRCYAGDKPPEPSRLPAGCDVRNLKIIPPA